MPHTVSGVAPKQVTGLPAKAHNMQYLIVQENKATRIKLSRRGFDMQQLWPSSQVLAKKFPAVLVSSVHRQAAVWLEEQFTMAS